MVLIDLSYMSGVVGTVVQKRDFDHIINTDPSTQPNTDRQISYFDLDLIFLLFRFRRLIRFFLHLALMVKLVLLYSGIF